MSPTPVGTAYVVVRALTKDVKKDIQKGFQDGLKDNKTLFARYGTEAGDEFSKNFAQRISKSVEKSLDGGTASTGNSGITAGRAFGRSFAREAETRMLDGHKATGAKKTLQSASDGEDAGRAFGARFAAESQRVLSERNLSGPNVNTSQAQAKIRALNAAGMSSSSLSINADVSGAVGSIASLTKSLGTLGKVSIIPVLTSALNGLTFSAISAVQSLGQVTNTVALLPGMIGGLLPVIGSVMLAFNGMGEAFKLALSSAPEDLEKLDEALKNLAPSARSFVKEVAAIKEPFVDMKKNIQQEFFLPLEGSIKSLAENTLPMLNRNLANVAGETGGLLRSVLDSVGETNNVSLFGRLFDNTAAGLETLQKGMQPTVSAILRLMEASSRFLPRMGEGWHNLMSTFDGFLARVTTDGTFEAYVNRGIDSAKQWGRILGDVGVTIGNVFKAAAPTTQAFMDMIERGTESMRAISGSFEGQNTMKSFFESGLSSVRQWNGIFKDLGGFLRDFLPVMQSWADIVMPVLSTVTGLLADNGELVGQLLVGFLAFKSVTGVLGLVNGGLSTMRTSLAGLSAATGGMGALSNMAGTLRTAVAPALTGVRNSASVAAVAFRGSLSPAIAGLGTSIRNLTPQLTGLRTASSSTWSRISTAAGDAAASVSRATAGVRGDINLLSRYGVAVARDAVSSTTSAVQGAASSVASAISRTTTPVFGAMTSAASTAGSAISRTFAPAISAITPAVNGMRTSVLHASMAMSATLTPAFNGARAAASNFATIAGQAVVSATSAASRGVSNLVNALGGPLNIAIMAATIGFANYQAGASRGKQAADDFANSQINLANATNEFRGSLLLASSTEDFSSAISTYSSAVDESVNSMVRFGDAAPSLLQKSAAGWDYFGSKIGITSGLTSDFVNMQADLSESGMATQLTLREMGMSTDDLTRALINGSPQYDNFVNRLAKSGPEGARAAAELDRTRLAIQSIEYEAANATSLDKYSAAMDVLSDKTAGASDKLNAFKTALDIATGVNLNQLQMDAENIEQIGETAEALQRVTAVTGEFTGAIDVNNEAHRELLGVMDDQRDSLGNTLIAMQQQGASQDEMTAKVAQTKQSFIDQATALTGNAEAAKILADQIFGIPAQTAASVSTPGLAESIEKFKQLNWHLGETPDQKGIYISDNAAEAINNIEGLEGVVKRDKNGRVYIDTSDVPRAAGEILSLNGKNTSSTHTVTTNYINGYTEVSTGGGKLQGPGIYSRDAPKPPGRADGAINKWTFANGGTRLPIEAKIQPSVGNQGLIQWAEASTHGEAFIPLNPSKKERSTSIWLETGKRLGLIKSNANGSITSGVSAVTDLSIEEQILEAIQSGFERTVTALQGFTVSGADRPSTVQPAASAAAASTGAVSSGSVFSELSGATSLGGAPETVSRTGTAISDTINNVVNPSMQSLNQQLATSKTAVIDPTFQGIQTGMTNLGMTIPAVAGSQINPALSGMGNHAMAVAQGVINPTLASVQNAMTNTGNVFGLITQGAINPMWNETANTIMGGVTGTIEPAFNGIMGGLGAVSNSFGQGASNIATQWDRVREATASPVRFAVNTVFNNGLIGMWNSVSDLLGTTKMNPYPLNFAEGGKVPMLPGASPNADSVPAMLMPKEFVVSKPMLKAIGGGNIDRGIGMLESVRRKAGKIPDIGPSGLFSNVKGYAGGGVVEGDDTWKRFAKAHMFAKSHHGKPYVWGGSIGPDGGTDCSGWVSSVADVVHGGSGLFRKWATGSFPGGGGSQGATGPQGFVQGLAAGLSAGVSTGHTAGTLGGVPGLPTVNIESGGSHNYVAYGGPAVGADHSQFPSRYHLAMAGLGRFMGGGGGGGGDVLGMIVGEGLEKIKSLASGFSGPGAISQIPNAVSEKLGGAVSGKIDKLMETVVAPGGAGSERWRPMLKRAMVKQGLTHWAQDEAIVSRFVKQIQTESGGDPNISQQIVDINGTGDAAGVGLGQIIPGTWAAYRDPSLADNRRDPWAHLNAMVRYVHRKYGDQGYMSIGNGIGYDQGGVLAPTPGGFGKYFNHTGKPEAVLTNEQWNGIFSTAVATAKLVDPLRELARNLRDLPRHMEITAKFARRELDAGLSAAGNAAWTALPAPVKDTIGQIQHAGHIWSSVSNYIGGKAEAWARGEWPIGSGRKASENAGPEWMPATLEAPLDKVVATNLSIAQRIANGQEDPGRDPAANAIYDIFGRAPIIPDLQRIIAGGPDQWSYAAGAIMATFETGFTEPMEAFTHETSQLTEAVLRVREAAIAIGDQVKATNDLFTAVGRLPGAAGTAVDRIFGPEGPIQRGLFSFNPAPSAAYEEAIRRIEQQEAERAEADASLEKAATAAAENDETTSDVAKALAETVEESKDGKTSTTEAAVEAAKAITDETAKDTADAIKAAAKVTSSTTATSAAKSTSLSSIKSYSATDDKPKGPSTWDTVAGHLHSQRWTEAANLIADTLQKDPRTIDPEGYDAWDQQFTNATGEWKRDAFKEITSPFFEPLGLDGFYQKHIDTEYDRLVAIATEAATNVAMRIITEERANRAGDSGKIAENLTVIGTSPEDLAEKLRREQEINLQNQNSRYRG